jgi:hypothetical protein
MKLFHVTTVVKELKGHRDVPVVWYRHNAKPSPERPYAQLIADYSAQDEYARYGEDCIDEMFTADEAKQLAAYLDNLKGGRRSTIDEQTLPISNNAMPLGAMPAGGGPDHLMFSENPGWPLPCEVWGYFDTRFCEQLPAAKNDLDGPIPF